MRGGTVFPCHRVCVRVCGYARGDPFGDRSGSFGDGLGDGDAFGDGAGFAIVAFTIFVFFIPVNLFLILFGGVITYDCDH